jgi:hypothetical protein
MEFSLDDEVRGVSVSLTNVLQPMKAGFFLWTPHAIAASGHAGWVRRQSFLSLLAIEPPFLGFPVRRLSFLAPIVPHRNRIN